MLKIGLARCILRFCETVQPAPQFLQETLLAAKSTQTDLHQRIVVAVESLVGLPVQAFGFGFAVITIQYPSLKVQPYAQLVCGWMPGSLRRISSWRSEPTMD